MFSIIKKNQIVDKLKIIEIRKIDECIFSMTLTEEKIFSV